jgi:hypothetical protein
MGVKKKKAYRLVVEYTFHCMVCGEQFKTRRCTAMFCGGQCRTKASRHRAKTGTHLKPHPNSTWDDRGKSKNKRLKRSW